MMCTHGGEFCVFRNSSTPTFQINVVLSGGKVKKSVFEMMRSNPHLLKTNRGKNYEIIIFSEINFPTKL